MCVTTSQRNGMWKVAVWLVLAILGTLPLARPLHAQEVQEEPIPLMLGQILAEALDAGESAFYRVELPYPTLYTIVLLKGDGSLFQILVRDEEGQVVWKGNLAEQEGELALLEAGSYTMELSTETGGQVSLMWSGLGLSSFGPSVNYPGRLYPGGPTDITGVWVPTSALLDVPNSPYPVLVYLVAEPLDTPQPLVLTVADRMEGVGFFRTADNGDDPGQQIDLVFWTAGGPFVVGVAPSPLDPPVEDPGAKVRVAAILGPRPEVQTVGDTVEGSLAEPLNSWVIPLEVDAFQRQITVTLTWDEPAVNLDLGLAELDPTNRVAPTQIVEFNIYSGLRARSLEAEGTQEEVVLEGVLPGRYLIVIYREDGFGIPVDTWTVRIQGEPGSPPQEIALDTPVQGTLAQGEVRYFRFTARTGQTIRIQAESDNPETELYLNVGLRPQGIPVLFPEQLYGTGKPSVEETFAAWWTGPHYIALRNFGERGEYRLVVELQDELRRLEPNARLRDRIGPGEEREYVLSVEESDGFLRLFLVGDDPEADLTLELSLADGWGNYPVLRTSRRPGSHEALGLVSPPPGDYRIRVLSDAEEPVSFVLLTRWEALGAGSSATPEAR